ncbi:unnamed protein product [Adineta ricciae]|uniref:Asl1-like glycosyl hydrolase catalytic domain-containing protein n=1 Tax=Adineta ricciae TaxID=249248 RepID=A0A815E9H7_ADIRI|nr:unnamed protein product [Adineta ricciae]CAF1525229.1 unnamed protein product [Adineta ricciae]
MSKKRGIAWPLENHEDHLNVFPSDRIHWFYNWSPDKKLHTNMNFIPMIWNAHGIEEFGEKVRFQHVECILGFNEPERSDQANMDPYEAARLWKEYIEPLRKQGIRLGSPSISSTEEGLNWLQTFLNQGCHIDFLALHWFGRGVDNFINYINNARQRLGSQYPVWITEFACTSWNANESVSQDEINQFFDQSLTRLDELHWIERYSWFGAMRCLPADLGSGNCLIDSNGQLSQLGRKYVNI